MDDLARRELERISVEVPRVRELIDQASDDDALPEHAHRARREVQRLAERYEAITERLSADDRMRAERDVGLKLEVLKAHLLKLDEDT